MVLFQTIQLSISKLFNVKTFLFQAIQFSQIILIQTVQFSISIVLSTQLNVKTFLFQIIQFSVV